MADSDQIDRHALEVINERDETIARLEAERSEWRGLARKERDAARTERKILQGELDAVAKAVLSHEAADVPGVTSRLQLAWDCISSVRDIVRRHLKYPSEASATPESEPSDGG